MEESVKYVGSIKMYNGKFGINHVKYRFKNNKYMQSKRLDTIANELAKTNNYDFDRIFSSLKTDEDKEEVLSIMLKLIGDIDNRTNIYWRIQQIMRVSYIPENIRNNFMDSVYEKCDNKLKFEFWLEGLKKTIDTKIIVERMIETQSNFGIDNVYRKIFTRLNNDCFELEVLTKFINRLGIIDNSKKYETISVIFRLGFPEKTKNELSRLVYEKSDNDLKFQFWLDGKIQKVDLDLVSEKIFEPEFSDNHIQKVFSLLETDTDKTEVLLKLFNLIGVVDDDDVKYNIIKSILELDKYKISDEIKHEFFNLAFNACDEDRKLQLWSEFVCDYQLPNLESSFFELIEKINFKYLFAFLLNNIKTLTVLTTDRNLSVLGIYLERVNYFQDSSSISKPKIEFYFNGKYLTNNWFENKIKLSKFIIKYLDDNEFVLLDPFRIIINQSPKEQISQILKNLNLYFHCQKQLCEDLRVPEPLTLNDFERIYLTQVSTDMLLKFWINDIIDFFDFNSYCYYYFTLNLEERKIFNKKVKALMKEEIKKSLLKQREPWVLLEDDKEKGIQIYSATWKSIWFMDRGIKLFIDKESSFTQFFPWEFSEEKFNLLYDYISGKRLKPLQVSAKGDKILSIEGLEQLEELIWKVQIQREVESGERVGIKNIGTNRIPVNMILRNQCIQLLNRLQVNELEPTRVLEKTVNIDNGGISVDISLLYSIPLNQNEIAIIWESLELEKSKATHIFKCLSSEYEDIFSQIGYNLTTQLKMRSRLRSSENEEMVMQKSLRYLTNIDHNNFKYERWENSLFEILPELKG